MNRILSKNLIRLTFTNKYNMASTEVCTYPYKFGGITNSEIKGHFSQIQLLNKIFGDNVLQGFKSAYIAVLQALRDKDKSFLQSTMEKNLIKNIKFQDVQLIKQQEPIQIDCKRNMIIIGSQFQRTQDNRNMAIVREEKTVNMLLLMNSNIFKKSPPPQHIPFLFCFDIYFRSKMKLIQSKMKANPNQNNDETHCIRFQVSKTKSLMQLLPLMMKLSKNNKDSPINAMQFFTSFIGQDYQWKIADVDHLLDGNFNIVQGGADNLFKF